MWTKASKLNPSRTGSPREAQVREKRFAYILAFFDYLETKWRLSDSPYLSGYLGHGLGMLLNYEEFRDKLLQYDAERREWFGENWDESWAIRNTDPSPRVRKLFPDEEEKSSG